MKGQARLILTILVLGIFGTALLITSSGDTQGDLFSATSNSGSPDQVSITEQIPLLATVESCDGFTYDKCISDTFEYGDAFTSVILSYDPIESNPTTSGEFQYTCEIGEKAYLVKETGNPTDWVTSWDDLNLDRGQEVGTSGSIPYDEINNGFTLACMNKGEASDGSWVSGMVWVQYDSFSLSSPEPSIQEYREPDVSTDYNEVSTTVYLENTGADMSEEWLVELSPRESSSLSFLQNFAFTGRTGTCDPDNPENVFETYQLDSGERDSTTLTSDDLDPGTYDVYLVSTTGCSNQDLSVTSTSPYEWGKEITTVTVKSPNNPPTVDSINVPDMAEVNEPVTASVSASDPDGDTLSYSWSNGGTGPETDYTFSSTGSKTISVTVSDGEDSVTETSTIDIVESNTAPVINQVVAPSEVTVDQAFSVSVDAEDADGDSLSYEWSNGETGQTASYVFSSTGTKEVSVSVSDGVDRVSKSVNVDVVQDGEDDTDDGGLFSGIIGFFTGLWPF